MFSLTLWDIFLFFLESFGETVKYDQAQMPHFIEESEAQTSEVACKATQLLSKRAEVRAPCPQLPIRVSVHVTISLIKGDEKTTMK